MTQVFNRGASLRYDMHGRKRKNHLANPVKKEKHIMTNQKVASPDVLKAIAKTQQDQALAKQDFFNRLKNSVCDNTKPDKKVYSGERKLIGIATMHKSNAVPIFEDNKQLAKDIAKMRR